MADHLARLSEPDVAAFYRRLAAFIQKKIGGESIAAILLLHWPDGGGKSKVYPAKFVRELDEVWSYLKDTARPIFLSQKPTPSGVTGGLVPRLRGTIPSNPPGGPYPMHLEGNVETPLSVQAKAAMGFRVEARELDALYGLHGFTVVSDVVASANQVDRSKSYRVKFESWRCKASDEYHWNPAKYITVPNPDYGSKDKAGVAPKDEYITVYHSNAARLEKAGLAKPFHNESETWQETNAAVVADAVINL